MEPIKNRLLDTIKIVIISIAMIASVLLLTNAFLMRNKENEIINVTGLGTKDFESDLIVWSGSFYRLDSDLKAAYKELSGDQEAITAFLRGNDIPEGEYVFSAIDISKEYGHITDKDGNTHSEFVGYNLRQTVTIESKDVDKIEGISRKITELIDKGVEFYSDEPRYYYTKLSELKMELIEGATQNARDRAAKIAEVSGSRLGKLKYSTIGVFQIIARNSSEDYSWDGAFNTSSKQKTATITIKLQFGIE
jgi:hypothetical protein